MIDIGDIQAFIQYMRTFTQPITQIAQISNMLQSMAAAAERELRRVTRHKQLLSESILSSAVSSSYYSNEKVLRTLDFEFTPVQETLRRVTRAYLEEKKR